MTRIYIVRHGNTLWNKDKIFRGHKDIPLDETGKEEAKKVADVMSEIKIDKIFSSPLLRAKETADIIAKPHNLDVEKENAFIDISFGEWQGISLNKVKEKWPKLYDKWLNEPDKVKFPKGDRLEDVLKRSVGKIKDLVNIYSDKNLLIVSHRVVNKVMILGCLGIDLSHFWQIGQDTCAINLILYNGNSFILSILNDTCHIAPIAYQGKKADF
ncbi:MAG: hypothetical protein DRG20_04490 [Deltaproteobacteria bacterium]|nr:histidine phosphatase family protein [Deltaproteobacteria bacterium]RLA89610.1 MAG: hypothetical protein DRG20_04490 [Deltaproteobacteria bacterium]